MRGPIVKLVSSRFHLPQCVDEDLTAQKRLYGNFLKFFFDKFNYIIDFQNSSFTRLNDVHVCTVASPHLHYTRSGKKINKMYLLHNREDA